MRATIAATPRFHPRPELGGEILGVDVHFFLDGVTSTKSAPGFAEENPPTYVADMMSTPEGLQLVRHFTGISNPKVRKSIVQLVVSLAVQDEAERSA